MGKQNAEQDNIEKIEYHETPPRDEKLFRVDMRNRDKHAIDGISLLPVFAERARSVEKALVHPRLQGMG